MTGRIVIPVGQPESKALRHCVWSETTRQWKKVSGKVRAQANLNRTGWAQRLKSGVHTTLRLLFARISVDERYRDVTSTTRVVAAGRPFRGEESADSARQFAVFEMFPVRLKFYRETHFLTASDL